jgi:hypothetical protein
VAADLVVKHANLHPLPGLGRQSIFELTAQSVGTKDVELDQDIVFSTLDAFEDRIEGVLAVNQQLYIVAHREGQFGQFFNGQLTLTFGEGDQVAGLKFVQVAACRRNGFDQIGTAQGHQSAKLAAPEHPIGGHRHVGKGDQPQHPGHGPLGRARFHDGLHRTGDAEHVKDAGDDGENLQSHDDIPFCILFTLKKIVLRHATAPL